MPERLLAEILPATTRLLVKSHVSSASSNIKLACVTPSPLYIDIPEVVAVAVSGVPCVVLSCIILSSTSTVVVLIVVVVPFTVKLPETVRLPFGITTFWFWSKIRAASSVLLAPPAENIKASSPFESCQM